MARTRTSTASFHRRAALLGAACSVAAWSAADAGDRRLVGSFSQQVIADTNVQLDQGDEASLGSISTVNLSYSDRRATSLLTLGTGLSYSAFTGEDNDNISGLFPDLNGAYTVFRPNRTLGFVFGVSVEPVDFFENTNIVVPRDPDIGGGDGDGDGGDGDGGGDGAGDGDDTPQSASRRTNRETLRLRANVGVNFNQQVNSTDSVSMGVNASRLDFLDNDGSLTPSTTFGYTAGWNRVFTSRINGGVSSSIRYLQADNDENRRTISFDAVPSLGWARTPKERWSFGLGPAFSSTRREVALLGGGTRVIREDTVSLRGNAGLSYVDGVNSFNVNLSQSAEPTDDGVLANRTSVSAGWGRRLSSTSSLNLGASATARTALSGDTSGTFEDDLFARFTAGYRRSINTFSSANASTFYQIDDEDGAVEEGTVGIDVGYSYRLTQETSANLGYGFRVQDGEETSHRVFLTLSRGFTILP